MSSNRKILNNTLLKETSGKDLKIILKNKSINSEKLADSAVKTVNIEDRAVNGNKMAYDSISYNHLDFDLRSIITKGGVFERGLGKHSVQQLNTGASATGENSFAIGQDTTASGKEASAEGDSTQALGNNSHAEGHNTEARGSSSHAEGKDTIAGQSTSLGDDENANYAHAEGYDTKALGDSSHSEGVGTTASGYAAHVGGHSSVASGDFSFASGLGVVANNEGEVAFGKHNISSEDTLFSIGNGEDFNKKNAFEVKENGDIHFTMNGKDQKLQDIYHGKVYLPENLQYIDYHFNRFVENVPIEDVGTDRQDVVIVYDTERKKFLAATPGDFMVKYYQYWLSDTAEYYQTPVAEFNYYCDADDKRYRWDTSTHTLVLNEAGTKVNVLTSEMLSTPNVIYVIQYDYYFDRARIEVPQNCVLRFDRGSFRDGTLVGNHTIVEYITNLDATLNVEKDGTFIYKSSYIPNNEDVSLNDNEQLQFADKRYEPGKFSGLGRVYLRKNMVNDGNYLDSEMLNQPNTIYVIQYDYEVSERIELYAETPITIDGVDYMYDNTPIIVQENDIIGACDGAVFITDPQGTPEVVGDYISATEEKTVYLAKNDNVTQNIYYYVNQSITIPENCVLKFEGGSLKNGTLIGQNTNIDAGDYCIFSNLEFSGNFDCTTNINWFPIVYNERVDNSKELDNALLLAFLSNSKYLKLNEGSTIWVNSVLDNPTLGPSHYYVDGSVKIRSGVTFDLNNSTIRCLPNDSIAYNILYSGYSENIKICNGTLIGDLEEHTGTSGEWGCGISLLAVHNFIIENVTISQVWGDGIFLDCPKLGHSEESEEEILSRHSVNGLITRCESMFNRRQGMSLDAGFSIIVENSKFHDIGGVLPQSGIDIEPGHYFNKVKDIIIKDCEFYNNVGSGLIISNLAANNIESIDNVVIKDCFTDNNGFDYSLGGKSILLKDTVNALRLRIVSNVDGMLIQNVSCRDITINKEPIIESLFISDCTFSSDAELTAGLFQVVSNDIKKNVSVLNCEFRSGTNTSLSNSTLIYIPHISEDSNFIFKNCNFITFKANYIYLASNLTFNSCTWNRMTACMLFAKQNDLIEFKDNVIETSGTGVRLFGFSSSVEPLSQITLDLTNTKIINYNNVNFIVIPETFSSLNLIGVFKGTTLESINNLNDFIPSNITLSNLSEGVIDGYSKVLKKEVFFSINKKNWLESDGAAAGVLRQGATSERPTAANIYVGFEYFDTTLGATVTWDGTKWNEAIPKLTDITLDKSYTPASYSGLGRVNLPKNMMFKGYHFRDFVSGVTIEQSSLTGNPTVIVFDTTEEKFLGVTNYGALTAKYYQNWSGDTAAIYVNPSESDTFICDANEKGYIWTGSSLAEKTTGTKYNVLTQRMISAANTIYHIQYDYDLDGQKITIPAGCTLGFDGGSFKNGTIEGQNTRIVAPDVLIFKKGLYRYRGYKDAPTDITTKVAYKVIGENIYINGSWNNDYASPAWIGLDTIPSTEDAAPIIMDYIALHSEGVKITLPQRTYGIYGQIAVRDRTFDGNNSTFIHCTLASLYDANIPIPTGSVALDSSEFPRGLPLMYQNIFIQDSGELCNFTIDQSNVTTSDIQLNNHWGIYGLVGKRGVQKSTISNVAIKNAYECGFIGITGETEFIDCLWDGSGEHEVYGRPDYGNITFRNCKFTNWENIQEIATARGEAFAIKLIPNPERAVDSNIKLIDCEFVKGDSYSSYCVQINGDSIYIQDCKTNVYHSVFAADEPENKVKHLYIDSCDGIMYDYQEVEFITHISNSNGVSNILQVANEVSNCVLTLAYPENIDARSTAPDVISDYASKLIVRNTQFICDSTSTTRIAIVGAYNISITDCNFITSGAALQQDGYNIEIKTNADDTEIDNVSPVLTIEGCNFLFGKRNNGYFYAKNYDINVVSALFRGGKYQPSGYLSNLYIFSLCKSLNIIDVRVIPAVDGTTLNLYGTNVTNATFVRPIPAAGNPSSNVGMMSFDYTNGKPIWWDGTQWVDATGTPV